MTSEPPRRIGRIGQVLTALIVLVCVVILTGLGVWQVKRLHWKEDLLRRVAAAQRAAAQPIGPVLERRRHGQDVEWTRVSALCGKLAAGETGPRPDATYTRYGVRDGEVVWRAIGVCWLNDPGLHAIALDRGVLDAWRGKIDKPSKVRLPAPVAVTGVLRVTDAERSSSSGLGGPPLILVVDREDPAPPGVSPAPYPANIPNNHLGYALTWFGLALALIGVYAGAMIKRRRRP
jgi:surfeit locus 1 family protein